MEFLYALLVLLLVTRTFGEIAHRLGVPALLGELIAGITLGAVFVGLGDSVPFLAELPEDRVFQSLTDLGIFFLMLFGGVEVRASELARVSGRSFVVAMCGFVVPIVLGYFLAWVAIPDSEYKVAQCLLVATALAITAVPVSIRVLMDLRQLNTPVGMTIVAAAILDDVFSLAVLAILTGLLVTGGQPDSGQVVDILISVVSFFAITFSLNRLLVPLIGTFVRSLRTPEFEFSSLLLAALALAGLAELLHLHFILGAFCAGLLFERRNTGGHVYDEVRKRFSAITLGFLAPIFFASVGMHLEFSAVREAPLFLVALVAVAFLSKLLGAGIPARMMGLCTRDALAVGVGMSARGAVELVIVDVALRSGIFERPVPTPPVVEQLYSSIVIMAVATTVCTPFLLKRVFSMHPGPEGTAAPPPERELRAGAGVGR
jgi:Kef-type K+ transport system membrane component KefB